VTLINHQFDQSLGKSEVHGEEWYLRGFEAGLQQGTRREER